MHDLTFAQTGQISGEIYIEEGLEQALNVDRRSFRETDPHYLMLQQHIWQEISAILQKSIDPQRFSGAAKQYVRTYGWLKSPDLWSTQANKLTSQRFDFSRS